MRDDATAASEAGPASARGGYGPSAPALVSLRVTRSRRPVAWSGVLVGAIVVLLAALPYLVGLGTTSTLTNVFVVLAMATMWNLLAGYAGLISVGQQAFVGLGAYFVLILAQRGLHPFGAIPVAALLCALVAAPIFWVVFRLRGGYFAIATWVVADACELTISQFASLGGGTGIGLPGLSGVNPTDLITYTYWAALAVGVLSVAFVYLLLRSRMGLVLTAVRDDEIGARSLGSRVTLARGVVFIAAALGCGAAGAVYVISQLNVQPTAAFSIGWAADMILVTIIGGIGSIEGPIIGTIVFFALQQALAGYGPWYLILLGLIAIVIAIWAPRGIWGMISDRLHVRPFPVGYWLWLPEGPGPGRARRGASAADGSGGGGPDGPLDNADAAAGSPG